MWALLAGQILEEVGQGTIPQMLKEKFLTGKKEVRTAVVPIFASLEIGSIPPLLDILKTSEDQWVRKNACEALIQIGSVAAAHLLSELEAGHTSIETTCDILKVLGQIKSDEWKAPLLKVLQRFSSHEHPKLREQSIHTLYQIGGSNGGDIFISRLDDPEIEIRKRAVWCLGMIKSAKGIEKMLHILKQISNAPSPEMDPLETQIYYAFGTSGNLTIEGITLEQYLIQVVEQRGIKRWWGLLEKHPLTDAALGAICDALGKIGAKESVAVLKRLEKSREAPWNPKAKEALKKIEERIKADFKS
jgi:HEAT repeat protein